MALNKNDKDENKGLKGAWTAISEKDKATNNSYLSSTWDGLKYGAGTMGAAFVLATTTLIGTMAVLDEENTVSTSDYEVANDANFNHNVNYAAVEVDGNYYLVVQDPQDRDRWQLYIGEINKGNDLEFTMVTDPVEAYSMIIRIKALIDVDVNAENLNIPYDEMGYYKIFDISGHYEEDGGVNRLAESFSYDGDYRSALELFAEAEEDLQQSLGSYGLTTAPDIVDDPHADPDDFLLALAIATGTLGVGAAGVGGLVGSLAGAGAEGVDRAINRRRRRKDEKSKNIPKP